MNGVSRADHSIPRCRPTSASHPIAEHPHHRNRGVGRDLVNHAEQALDMLACMKINLQIVASNQATTEFYEKLGYQIEPRISMGKLLGSL
jgi:ribosomal protein S18 acetylase RimI-like enzyme